jgi:hypothetical protein
LHVIKPQESGEEVLFKSEIPFQFEMQIEMVSALLSAKRAGFATFSNLFSAVLLFFSEFSVGISLAY